MMPHDKFIAAEQILCMTCSLLFESMQDVADLINVVP